MANVSKRGSTVLVAFGWLALGACASPAAPTAVPAGGGESSQSSAQAASLEVAASGGQRPTIDLTVPSGAEDSCANLSPGCFKGTFEGEDAHDVLPPGATSVAIRTTAAGTGTRLGHFSLIRQITGDLTNLSATGSAHWVAANHDSIDTTIDGTAEPSDRDGGSLKVTETHIITRGTGRFAGARGHFEVVLFHKLEPSSVADGVESHDITGSFQGTVAFPGPPR